MENANVVTTNFELTNAEYWKMRSIVSEMRLVQCQRALLERSIKDANDRMAQLGALNDSLVESRTALSAEIASRVGVDKIGKEYTIVISEDTERGELVLKP